jgi:hypothetical protein
MLPIIQKTNNKVIETFKKLEMLPEPKPAVATVTNAKDKEIMLPQDP